MVVYFHSYTTGVNFLDGTSVLALPVWLQAIEKGLSQVIAGCNVQIFSAFCNPAVPVRERYGTVLKKKTRAVQV